MSVFQELRDRDIVSQTTDEAALRRDLQSGPMYLYCGFDPTAESLHLGNLVQILTVRRFQLYGHKPLALVGGATGLIGDPKMTGERMLNSLDVVDVWLEKIRVQLEKFFDFSSSAKATMVNNYEWTKDLTAIELLRGIGKHFSVNRMIAKDAISARLNSTGISYTEFSYSVLQAYDYLQLYRQYGCRLQTGGSDQWGNITAGVDLVRKVEGENVHGLTTHLLTKADGTKFGKTETGTVWLDPDKTSPYQFYQFWLNSDDRDVVKLLKVFTFFTLEEIAAFEIEVEQRPHARVAHKALAEHMTSLVHSEEINKQVVVASKALFGQEDLQQVDVAMLRTAVREAGGVMFSSHEEVIGTMLIDCLVDSGLCKSKSDARRMITSKSVYVNNVVCESVEKTFTAEDLLGGRVVVLRRGKKTVSGVVVDA